MIFLESLFRNITIASERHDDAVPSPLKDSVLLALLLAWKIPFPDGSSVKIMLIIEKSSYYLKLWITHVLKYQCLCVCLA